MRFFFAYNVWAVPARRKLDLDKIRAALNITCLHCGAEIPPNKQVRISFEQHRCPNCGKEFVPAANK